MLTDIYGDEAMSYADWRWIWRGAEGDQKGRD